MSNEHCIYILFTIEVLPVSSMSLFCLSLVVLLVLFLSLEDVSRSGVLFRGGSAGDRERERLSLE